MFNCYLRYENVYKLDTTCLDSYNAECEMLVLSVKEKEKKQNQNSFGSEIFPSFVILNVWIGLFADVNMAAERRQNKSRSSPPRR